MFFFTRQKPHRVKHWQLGECDLIISISIAYLLRHEKERNCALMWCVLSQDYQRKYKWVTMCSYIKALNVQVPQYCVLWAEAQHKKPLEHQWHVAQSAWSVVQSFVNANLLWQNCNCSGPVKLESICKVKSPLCVWIQTFLLLNVMWWWGFYSRILLTNRIFYISQKHQLLVSMSFNM